MSKTPRDTGTFEYPYEDGILEPILHDNELYRLPSQDFTDEISDPSFFQGDYYYTSSSSSSSSSFSSSSFSSFSSHSISCSSSSHSSHSISCSSSSPSSSSPSSSSPSSSSCSSSYSISSSCSSCSSSSSTSLCPIWADNARVVPPQFYSGDTICALYDYHSCYPESGSQIRWYKNDVYQPDHDNKICFVVTGRRGDIWYFYITPCDAFHCGTPVRSTPGVMLNNPPTAPTRVEIVPHNPQVDDDLFVIVSGSTDVDGDRIVYHVRWYRTRDGSTEELTAYRNKLSIPYTVVQEGDIFSVEARAFDGTEESP